MGIIFSAVIMLISCNTHYKHTQSPLLLQLQAWLTYQLTPISELWALIELVCWIIYCNKRGRGISMGWQHTRKLWLHLSPVPSPQRDWSSLASVLSQSACRHAANYLQDLRSTIYAIFEFSTFSKSFRAQFMTLATRFADRTHRKVNYIRSLYSIRFSRTLNFLD